MAYVMNPNSFRLGYSKTWSDQWYTNNKLYPILLNQLLTMRGIVLYCLTNKKVQRKNIYVSHIHIGLKAGNLIITIFIYDTKLLTLRNNYYLFKEVSELFQAGFRPHFFDDKRDWNKKPFFRRKWMRGFLTSKRHKKGPFLEHERFWIYASLLGLNPETFLLQNYLRMAKKQKHKFRNVRNLRKFINARRVYKSKHWFYINATETNVLKLFFNALNKYRYKWLYDKKEGADLMRIFRYFFFYNRMPYWGKKHYNLTLPKINREKYKLMTSKKPNLVDIWWKRKKAVKKYKMYKKIIKKFFFQLKKNYKFFIQHKKNFFNNWKTKKNKNYSFKYNIVSFKRICDIIFNDVTLNNNSYILNWWNNLKFKEQGRILKRYNKLFILYNDETAPKNWRRKKRKFKKIKKYIFNYICDLKVIDNILNFSFLSYIEYHFILRLMQYNVRLRYFKRKALFLYKKKYKLFTYWLNFYNKILKEKKKKNIALLLKKRIEDMKIIRNINIYWFKWTKDKAFVRYDVFLTYKYFNLFENEKITYINLANFWVKTKKYLAFIKYWRKLPENKYKIQLYTKHNQQAYIFYIKKVFLLDKKHLLYDTNTLVSNHYKLFNKYLEFGRSYNPHNSFNRFLNRRVNKNWWDTNKNYHKRYIKNKKHNPFSRYNIYYKSFNFYVDNYFYDHNIEYIKTDEYWLDRYFINLYIINLAYPKPQINIWGHNLNRGFYKRKYRFKIVQYLFEVVPHLFDESIIFAHFFFPFLLITANLLLRSYFWGKIDRLKKQYLVFKRHSTVIDYLIKKHKKISYYMLNILMSMNKITTNDKKKEKLIKKLPMKDKYFFIKGQDIKYDTYKENNKTTVYLLPKEKKKRYFVKLSKSADTMNYKIKDKYKDTYLSWIKDLVDISLTSNNLKVYYKEIYVEITLKVYKTYIKWLKPDTNKRSILLKKTESAFNESFVSLQNLIENEKSNKIKNILKKKFEKFKKLKKKKQLKLIKNLKKNIKMIKKNLKLNIKKKKKQNRINNSIKKIQMKILKYELKKLEKEHNKKKNIILIPEITEIPVTKRSDYAMIEHLRKYSEALEEARKTTRASLDKSVGATITPYYLALMRRRNMSNANSPIYKKKLRGKWWLRKTKKKKINFSWNLYKFFNKLKVKKLTRITYRRIFSDFITVKAINFSYARLFFFMWLLRIKNVDKLKPKELLENRHYNKKAVYETISTLWVLLQKKPFLDHLTKNIDLLVECWMDIKIKYNFFIVTNNELPAEFIAKHIAWAFRLGYKWRDVVRPIRRDLNLLLNKLRFIKYGYVKKDYASWDEWFKEGNLSEFSESFIKLYINRYLKSIFIVLIKNKYFYFFWKKKYNIIFKRKKWKRKKKRRFFWNAIFFNNILKIIKNFRLFFFKIQNINYIFFDIKNIINILKNKILKCNSFFFLKCDIQQNHVLIFNFFLQSITFYNITIGNWNINKIKLIELNKFNYLMHNNKMLLIFIFNISFLNLKNLYNYNIKYLKTWIMFLILFIKLIKFYLILNILLELYLLLTRFNILKKSIYELIKIVVIQLFDKKKIIFKQYTEWYVVNIAIIKNYCLKIIPFYIYLIFEQLLKNYKKIIKKIFLLKKLYINVIQLLQFNLEQVCDKFSLISLYINYVLKKEYIIKKKKKELDSVYKNQGKYKRIKIYLYENINNLTILVNKLRNYNKFKALPDLGVNLLLKWKKFDFNLVQSIRYGNLRWYNYSKLLDKKTFIDYFYKDRIIWGYKFRFAGRFSRKRKRSIVWIKKGMLPTGSHEKLIDYGAFIFSNTFSAFSVRVWINRNTEFKHKYFLKV